MALRWLWLFVVFAFNLSLLISLTYFAADKASDKVLFGISFKSVWTFWGGFVIAALPLYLASSYLFYYAYWYGYHRVFPDRMWLVIVTNWTANLLVNLLVTWLYFGELPSKNAVAALIFIAGALSAIFWRS